MNRKTRLHLILLAALILLGLAGLARAALPAAAEPPAYDCAAATGIDAADCAALVALYTATDGPNWTDNSNWLSSSTPCGPTNGWAGVTCDGGRVSQLLLDNNGLSGPLPGGLADLTEMTLLQLSNNSLTGAIPAGLGSMTKLFGLYLNGNSLTGSIPSDLGGLAEMQFFYLNGNMLEGVVPVELCALLTEKDPEIINFDLNHNRLDNSAASNVCLNSFDPAWRDTQTVPPQVTAVDTSVDFQITLRWTPIAYTTGTGGYEIFMATTPGGYGPTPDRRVVPKSVGEATFTGLTSGQDYYFVIRTYSDPNDFNDNLVESIFAPEVTGRPVAVTLLALDGAAGAQPLLAWLLGGALLLGLLLVPVAVNRWAARRGQGGSS
jgi:hypothetical protein